MTHGATSILLLGLAVAACRTSQDNGQSTAPSGPPATEHAARPATGTSGGFETKSLVLYQPDEVLRERVPSAEILAAYIKELQGVCTAHWADASVPEVLDIVIAIKPGGRARAWFVSPSRSDEDEFFRRLHHDIKSVKPPAIRVGPVAFAIVAAIGGAQRTPEGPDGFRPPMPKAWSDAAAKNPGHTLVPDGVLLDAWPDP